MDKLILGKAKLTLEDVERVALRGQKVVLGEPAKRLIKKSRVFLEKEIAAGKTIYGVNTGFGLLSNVRISTADLETLQINLLRSHAVGMGDPIAESDVRAMLLLRAQALSFGHSGVRVALVEQILACLNAGIHPVVPCQGSVGASGDLAPLAHLALVLVGEGEAYYQGRRMKGADALKKARIKPLRLQAKEGLALINGTQFMTAIGSLAILEAEYLADVADLVGAMTVEAMRGTETAFEPEIHAVRPHPGQMHVAKRLKTILMSAAPGKKPGHSAISKSHENCGKVQDPYSVRCMPQVHGASRDSLTFVRQALEREINSVTDNPLVFADQGKVLSGGNFHGQMVSIAMDLMSIALAELASISEQRIEKLVNPVISELPAFLTAKGGINSGFMIVQVAAASIVSENKTLCHPASVDSIPTSADKEDHVSMGAWAARKAQQVLHNTRRVLAMELMSSAQGLEFLRPLRSSYLIEQAHAKIRKHSKFVSEDRFFHKDLIALENLLISRAL